MDEIGRGEGWYNEKTNVRTEEKFKSSTEKFKSEVASHILNFEFWNCLFKFALFSNSAC